MELTSLQYFIELSKDMNMTRTSRRLFVSQQTMSNHIARLEAELGSRLFERKPSLTLTEEGKAVLAFAQTVVRERSSLNSTLEDIRGECRGEIRLGATRSRAEVCLSGNMSDFINRYPNVAIRFYGYNSDELEQMLLEDELDIAIVRAGPEDERFVRCRVADNPLCFCVSEELLERYCPGRVGEIKEQLLRGSYREAFECLPVCMTHEMEEDKQREWFSGMDVILHAARPALICNTFAATRLGFQNEVASIVTHNALYVCRNEIPAGLNIFPLRQGSISLKLPLQLVCLKDRYLPRYARYFWERALHSFEEMEKTPLFRVV